MQIDGRVAAAVVVILIIVTASLIHSYTRTEKQLKEIIGILRPKKLGRRDAVQEEIVDGFKA